jgi:hypothetical protein
MLEDGTTFYFCDLDTAFKEISFLEKKGSAVSERIVYDEIMINAETKLSKYI